MGLLLVVLFVAVPIAELYVILQIGSLLGVLPTIALLIFDSVLGAVLLRSQGLAAWRRFTQALAAGRMPGREVIDGALVIFGGALLLTPGFLTDALGLALLIPPTRALLRIVLVRRFAGRIVTQATAGATGPMGRAFGSQTDPTRRPQEADERADDVVEGTASDIRPRRDEGP